MPNNPPLWRQSVFLRAPHDPVFAPEVRSDGFHAAALELACPTSRAPIVFLVCHNNPLT
jgi:hypothetical protein